MTMLTDEQTRIYKTAILAFKVDAAKAEAESGWRFPEKVDVEIVTELIEIGQLESRMKWVGGDVMYRQHRINESLRSEISAGDEDERSDTTRAALAPASPTTTSLPPLFTFTIQPAGDEFIVALGNGDIHTLASTDEIKDLIGGEMFLHGYVDSGHVRNWEAEIGELTNEVNILRGEVAKIENVNYALRKERDALRLERSARIMPDLLALVSALVAERDGLRARDGALFDAIDQIAAERRDVVDNHQTVKNASRANSNGEVAYFSGKSAGLQVALDILAETLPAPVSSRSQSGDETPGGEQP